MDNSIVRVFLIIYYLSDMEYHTADDLAYLIEVSRRTIFNDIKSMSNTGINYGCRVKSNKKGYYLEIINQELFEQCKSFILKTIMRSPIVGGGAELIDRPFDILRILFGTHQYLTIQELADELYLTKDTLRNDMVKARKILSTYHLEYAKTSRSSISGKEFDKRNCMLYLYHVFFSDYQNFKLVGYHGQYLDAFFQSFQCDEESRKYIEKMDHNYIRKHILINNGMYGRLSAYLILMLNRIESGDHCEFTKEEVAFIQGFQAYKEAEYVIDTLRNDFDAEISTNEVCGFALMILFNIDIDSESNLEENYRPVFQEAKEIAIDYAYILNNAFRVDLMAVPCYLKIMTSYFISFLIKVKFGQISYRSSYILTANKEEYGDPMAASLAVRVRYFLSRKFQVQINNYELSLLTSKLSAIISTIPKDLKEVRIAVVSNYGIDNAKSIAQNLKHYIIDKERVRIEPKSFSDVWDRSGYDIIVAQYFQLYGVKHDHILYVGNLLSYKNISDLILLINQVRSEDKRSTQLFENSIYVDLNYKYKDTNTFCHYLAERYSDTEDGKKRMESLLKSHDYFFCLNRNLVIVLDKVFSKHNFCHIYSLNKNKENIWFNHHINNIIIVSADLNNSLSDLRYLRDLLYVLSSNQKALDVLIETKDISQIGQYFINM